MRGFGLGAVLLGALLNPAQAALYAEYHFEETSYNGTAGQVRDTSGNGRHARTVGLASSSASGRSGRGLLIADNTTSTTAALDTGIDINDLGAAGTISFWFRSTASGDGWKILYDASTSTSAKFYLVREGDVGTDGIEAGITLGTSLRKVYDANGIDDTQWSHVTVTWSATGMRAYVKNADCSTRYDESLAVTGLVNVNTGTLYIGDNRSTAVDGETHTDLASANGTFDVVRIYDHAQTPTEVSANCANAASLHHLEVTTEAGSATTGTPVTFSIKACANAACSALYTGGVTGTLSVAGAGVATTYNTGAAFSMAAGSATTTETVTLSKADGGTATVNLTGLSPLVSGSPAVYCGLGSAASSSGSCTFNITPAVHHLELTAASNTALTCQPITYTIKACSNATCSSTYTGGISGTLSVSGVTVNYPGGSGFTIPVGSATTTISAHATTVGTATASLTGLSITPSNAPAVFCGMGSAATSGGSCAITVADAGLFFNVPDHVAGDSQVVTVSAVRKADNSLMCTPAFASGVKNIQFSCAHGNPSTGFMPVRVAGLPLNAANDVAAACDGMTRTVPLLFNASGVATTTVDYADAGQVNLSARYTGSGSDAGLNMAGTDAFVAVPADFAIGGVTAGPIKAGASFSASVTARNRTGAATPNFGRELLAVAPTVSFAKRQPTGGASQAGIFSGSLGVFSGGVATASALSWSEVGNGDLIVSVSNYLSSGLGVSGSTGNGPVGNVGPFRPAHFTVEVTQACTAGAPFTYSGQPFAMTVRARNVAGGITRNHDGSGAMAPSFAKSTDLSVVTNPGSGTLAVTSLAPTAFSAGEAVLTTQSFTFQNKLTAPAVLTLRAIDSDGVSSENQTEQGPALRSGRLQLANAFGNGRDPLRVPVTAQHWSGKAWVLNDADSCTAFSAPSVVRAAYVDSKGSPTTAWSTSVSSIVPVSNGRGAIILTAPANGATGSVDLSVNLGSSGTDQSCLSAHPASVGAMLPWLRSLNGACSAAHDRDPTARATFGVFAPETQRLIHSRDLF
jgi:MSHA biogenesis protein MshQ